MKKIFVSNKNKIEHYRRKRYLHNQKRAKIREKNWRIRQNEILQKENEFNRKNKNTRRFSDQLEDRKENIITIDCPKYYSFINNTDEFIAHLNQASDIWKKWKCIDFNLRDIEELTFDSLCLLLAFTKDRKIFPKWVKWNFPKNYKIKEYIRSSWFLFDNKKKEWWMFNYKKLATDKKLSLELSEKIIKKIQEYTFLWKKEPVQKAKVHPFMVEAMKNTDDHAWEWCNWRGFYQKWENRITKVCFLDLWEWILNTMYSKFEQLFWFNPFDILWGLFKWKFDKVNKRTKTKEEKRWTWLPKIYNFLTWDHIQNAFAITNNVKYDVKNNHFYRLKFDFHWTFYYREIVP